MSFNDTQNPGIGGLDELTDSEALLIQQLNSLGDPGADRILFWDESANSYAWLELGTNLTITNTTLDASGGGGGTVDGSGTTDELAYWVDSNTLGALAVATYPSKAEIAHVKGVTSAIQTQLDGKASSLGADDNYVTDAEKVKLFNLSGTNTGDQTSVSGNAGTATALQNTRTIWGQNFDGTANVTGTLALGTSSLTLTGSIGATGARSTKVWATDIESTNMPTVGGTSLSSTFLALAGGTITGNITLGENTSIALDPAGSADGKYSGITITGVAGYAQAFGDLVYLSSSDSRWELADADSATTSDRMLAMVVVAGGSDGAACTLLLQGVIRADAKFPTLTIGSAVYVGETAGEIQVAIPTGADNVIRRVGYALTADEIYFNPSMDSQITVA